MKDTSFPSPRRKYVLAAAVAISAISGTAAADCPDGPKASIGEETTRIRACLTHHSRVRNGGAAKLDIWAHTNKVTDMLGIVKAQYCAKYSSQQNRADELRIRRTHGDVAGDIINEAKALAAAQKHLNALKADFD